jgi:hypothetical protein
VGQARFEVRSFERFSLRSSAFEIEEGQHVECGHRELAGRDRQAVAQPAGDETSDEQTANTVIVMSSVLLGVGRGLVPYFHYHGVIRRRFLNVILTAIMVQLAWIVMIGDGAFSPVSARVMKMRRNVSVAFD